MATLFSLSQYQRDERKKHLIDDGRSLIVQVKNERKKSPFGIKRGKKETKPNKGAIK